VKRLQEEMRRTILDANNQIASVPASRILHSFVYLVFLYNRPNCLIRIRTWYWGGEVFPRIEM